MSFWVAATGLVICAVLLEPTEARSLVSQLQTGTLRGKPSSSCSNLVNLAVSVQLAAFLRYPALRNPIVQLVLYFLLGKMVSCRSSSVTKSKSLNCGSTTYVTYIPSITDIHFYVSVLSRV